MRLCYFTSWTGGRESKYARFGVGDIDPTLCTHLVYAFAGIDVDSHRIVPLDPQAENPAPGVKGRWVYVAGISVGKLSSLIGDNINSVGSLFKL